MPRIDLITTSIEPNGDFDAGFERHRRELLAHCYQMLGSFHDAEDAVQETVVRAWRARDRYDTSLASLRTWLHRIATNVCLDALAGRKRRPLPSNLVPVGHDIEAPLVPDLDVPWLQPLPTARLTDDPTDPAVQLVARGQVRLAFTAALQLLPARQRAVLILREVLEHSAADVAAMLDTTPAAVNSALQRARATLLQIDTGVGVLDDEEARATVEAYADAFERADVARLTSLLTADAVLEMPPVPLWYVGRADHGAFIERIFRVRGTRWRTVVTSANGQPALAAYLAGDDGSFRLHTIQVFTVTDAGIARAVVFQAPDVLASFGLAPAMPPPDPGDEVVAS